MTDLEITRLCAEAMFNPIDKPIESRGQLFICYHPLYEVLPLYHPYDPLHDDAQAMALVKTFGIGITCVSLGGKLGDEWKVYLGSFRAKDSNLNRAICECVAKMQKTK